MVEPRLHRVTAPGATTSRAAGVAIACVGLALAWQIVPYQLDDAYITYRYATQLAEGRGLAYNPGEAWSEGFSSPLWLLGLAGAATLVGPAALPSLGLSFGLGAYALALALAWRVAVERDAAWRALVPLALIAWSPAVVYYAVTGLEALLFLACVLAFAGCAAGRLPLAWGVAAAGAAPWVRPEGGWLPVMLAAQLAAEGRARDLRARPALALFAAVVAGGLALVALRLVLFGQIFPNPFYAKPADWLYGAVYAGGSLLAPWALGLVLLGLLGVLAGEARSRGFFAAALAWVAAAALEGGDWMPNARLLLPALGLFALAAGGLTAPASPVLARLRGARQPWTATLAAGLALLAVLAYDVRAVGHQARADRAAMRSLHQDARRLMRWLDAAGVRSLALVDIGVIGYRTRLEIVDLVGLVDTRIARSPGPHLAKQFDLAYLFEERRPDVIVSRLERPPEPEPGDGPPVLSLDRAPAPVENRILKDPRFARAYRRHHVILPGFPREPYYGLAVYTRRDFAPRPEAAQLLPPPGANGAIAVFTVPARGPLRAP